MDLGISTTSRTALFPEPMVDCNCHNHVFLRERGTRVLFSTGYSSPSAKRSIDQYLGLDLHYLLVAFVDRSMTPGGALAYFHGPGNDPARYASAVIFAFLALLGDGFMVNLFGRLQYESELLIMRRFHRLIGCSWYGTARQFLSSFLASSSGPMWVGALTPRVMSLSESSHYAVATGLVGKALLRGGPATLDIVFVPGGRPPLTAYFVMTLLTNLGTTREYYIFSERS